MIRQQRRKETRDCEKELKKIGKNSFFQRVLADKEITERPPQELDLLIKGEHSDKTLQARYNLYTNLTRYIFDLETRLKTLRGEIE